jgi:hypothetical protein
MLPEVRRALVDPAQRGSIELRYSSTSTTYHRRKTRLLASAVAPYADEPTVNELLRQFAEFVRAGQSDEAMDVSVALDAIAPVRLTDSILRLTSEALSAPAAALPEVYGLVFQSLGRDPITADITDLAGHLMDNYLSGRPSDEPYRPRFGNLAFWLGNFGEVVRAERWLLRSFRRNDLSRSEHEELLESLHALSSRLQRRLAS